MGLGEDVGLSITPRKVQQQVQHGRDRLSRFRRSRLMFIRNYCGQYYDQESGEVGNEPLNMIYNAVRIMVPFMVMNYPRYEIETPFLAVRQYADLLSLALTDHSKKSSIDLMYRRVIVDALFTLGILKTGLAESDSIVAMDGANGVDAGEIFTSVVDFDNFICDPASREHKFLDARFLGDVITVPRRVLLESGRYKNDLVERLPRSGYDHRDGKAWELSMREVDHDDIYGLEDEVDVIELWVPGANATVTIPADKGLSFDDYLRVDDFYGVKQGPYTLLTLSPPVSGNPLPVPSVGIWNDLHVLSNRMAKKIVDQAMRQKDLVGYKGSAADDAQEALDAPDGTAVKMDDPDGLRTYSFGGQQTSNEAHLQQLQLWFNQMAGNPDTMGGQNLPTQTATGQKILAGNASIGLDDAKDMVYKMASEEGRRRAWYLHTDPLINLPLIKRSTQPAQFVNGQMVIPAQQMEQQVFLTPEARSGDFFDFVFSVEPESMGRQDSTTRFQQAMDFCVKIVPSVSAAAQQMAMIGVPFSPKAMLLRMAKNAGITWMDEVFADPEFQMQMMQRLMAGPQESQSKGTIGPETGPQAQPGFMDQIIQNGQPAAVMGGQPSPMQQINSQFQQGAIPGQQMTHSFLGDQQ